MSTKLKVKPDRHWVNFRVYLWILSAAIFLICAILFIIIIIINSPSQNTSMELEEIEDFLGVTIPENAINVTFTSDASRLNGYIALQFKVKPQNLNEFTHNLCNGELHKGYNPFNAVDTISASDRAYLIKALNFTYYSYSPNTPASILGNRCTSPYGGIHQIVVDASSTELYAIRFEQAGGNCNSMQIPCLPLGTNYVNPFPDFPLMVVGLTPNGEIFSLIHNEICFDSQQSYIASWVESWTYLIGASVKLSLDDYEFPVGVISDQGRLIPSNGDIVTEQNQSYWYYCVKRNWEIGLYEVIIEIVTRTSDRLVYTFNFNVTEEN